MIQAGVVQEIIRRIVAKAHPERIVLFGSAARDEAGPHSDIDLLIVKSNVHQRRLAMELYEALADLGQPVDLIVATPEDLARYGHSLALVFEPALREGKVIYAA